MNSAELAEVVALVDERLSARAAVEEEARKLRQLELGRARRRRWWAKNGQAWRAARAAA